jgi:hypothetical protein
VSWPDVFSANTTERNNLRFAFATTTMQHQSSTNTTDPKYHLTDTFSAYLKALRDVTKVNFSERKIQTKTDAFTFPIYRDTDEDLVDLYAQQQSLAREFSFLVDMMTYDQKNQHNKAYEMEQKGKLIHIAKALTESMDDIANIIAFKISLNKVRKGDDTTTIENNTKPNMSNREKVEEKLRVHFRSNSTSTPTQVGENGEKRDSSSDHIAKLKSFQVWCANEFEPLPYMDTHPTKMPTRVSLSSGGGGLKAHKGGYQRYKDIKQSIVSRYYFK